MSETNQPHISHLRAELLATLADLRSRSNPMEPDRARAIAAVAGVIVDSARVEVEYAKATGCEVGTFLREREQPDDHIAKLGSWPSVVTHKLQG